MGIKLFLVFNTILLVLSGFFVFYFYTCKKYSDRRRQNTLIFGSVFSFSFLWEVVFLLLLPAPESIVHENPTLFMIPDSSNNWIGIWLAIIDLLVSMVTALAALYISFKQDDLVKFEFETSLIPLFKTEGFNCHYISNGDTALWDLHKSSLPQNLDFKNFGGLFILDFTLQKELNPNLNYSIDSLSVYRGFLSGEQTNKATAISSLEKEFVSLSVKQKSSALVWECQLVVEDRMKNTKEFNKFLYDLECPSIRENSSKYTVLLEITLKSKSSRYNMTKKMKLWINLVNEAALFHDHSLDNAYKIYSVSHEFVI